MVLVHRCFQRIFRYIESVSVRIFFAFLIPLPAIPLPCCLGVLALSSVWGTIDDREILMLDDVSGRSGMGIKGQGNKMCHLTPATGQRSTGVESLLGGLFFLAI